MMCLSVGTGNIDRYAGLKLLDEAVTNLSCC